MEYNPFAPAVIENPYPYYAELRAKSPVAWVEVLQGWVVSRYADVDFVLHYCLRRAGTSPPVRCRRTGIAWGGTAVAVILKQAGSHLIFRFSL